MSLRILFADDSVTAQNMGKKILTEAGYEVVAVSNGAAAVKKIAEQKPDIIILDVYMPGYSGLEVCEKVRGSVETMKTPVLLTVGKLEPYKPEDANRVRADGVIVKPFEASDLLAIIKKFEERLAQVPVSVPQPARAERFKEEIATPPEPVEHPPAPVALQPMVEVPDHMATTAAFSDLLGAEPSLSANHFDSGPLPAAIEAPAPAVLQAPPVALAPPPPAVLEVPAPMVLETPPPVVLAPPPAVLETPAPVVFETPAPVVPYPPTSAALETSAFVVLERPTPAALETSAFVVVDTPTPKAFETSAAAAPARVSIPDYEVPISWREPQPVEAEIPVTAAAETTPSPVELEPEPFPSAPAAARPLKIPVYEEPEAEIAYELMPTSAPPLGEIELPREPELQETAAEATRSTIAHATDPALLPNVQQFDPMQVSANAMAAEMAPLDEEFPPAGFQDIPSEIAAHLPVSSAATEAPRVAPAEPAVQPVSDNDFEARVAAALAAYGHSHPDAPPEVSQIPVPDSQAATTQGVQMPVLSKTAGYAEEQSNAEATESPETWGTPAVVPAPAPIIRPASETRATAAIEIPEPEATELESNSTPASFEDASVDEIEGVSEFEYRPPVSAPAEDFPTSLPVQAVEASPAPDAGWAAAEIPEPATISESATPEPDASADLVAGIEDALPRVAAEAAVAAHANSDTDHRAIAQAVNRVMERLKPELVEEIMRELKSKKE